MLVKYMVKAVLLYLMFNLFCFNIFAQQDKESKNEIRVIQKNLNGPRLGITFVPGHNEIYNKIREQKMGRIISQFGWQFEWLTTPNVVDAPSFVVEFIPLISGVEYSKFIPSASLVLGIRFFSGYEMGLGPNIGVSGSSLAIALGKSYDFNGVYIPVNIAYVLNPKGNRWTFLIGYAL